MPNDKTQPEWILTAEERNEVLDSLPHDAKVGDGRIAICQAQARNLLEWLEDRCPHAVYRKFCPICWDELRKEAGL